ncbi:uncharacterized protein LOC106670269 [Cimex lectularius]|uniref:Ubiquitin-associated protein 1 n=1 Tax=Cimex lectularius TaxID=79782 RepID=A0A8I6TGI2_CIMLE|nr:uncharacterized protein LOC106670269 [Cimex lectularius]XP_014255936.1 uncharacterized protein LOC106670269 [Cimex lectularius]XP_014255937.1 uncharacterized protein LOC106670269 [Cimex lectularius]XP_014255938.1 uncharacterized protein LOC106670269 [Cimex lectularius]
MEGIPVKISEQYKPPRKITLPMSVRNKINVIPTFETYDFKLEHAVVDRLSKLEKLKKSQLEKRLKRLELLKKFDVTRNKTTAGTEDRYPNETRILTPVPIFLQNKTETHKEKKQEGAFNLSDFENDTSSPFDNIELKTINDMEELAHVLGSSNISQNHVIPRARESLPNGFANHWQANCHNNTGYSPNSPYMNNIAPTYHIPPTLQSHGPLHSTTSSNMIPQNYTNSPITRAAVSYNLPVVNPLEDSYSPNLIDQSAESKEEYDILKNLQKIIEDRKLEIQIQRPEPAQACTSSLVTNNSQIEKQNEYEQQSTSLNEQERLFARNMAEMGFPYPRVARAVQYFGQDEAKVVEFLLQVQSLLEDKQFREDQIEKALCLNDFEEEKTRQYLENFIQFKNLGFKEDDIIAALAKTSDRDKALDFLIS